MTKLARGTYRTVVHVRSGTLLQPGPKLAQLYYGVSTYLGEARTAYGEITDAVRCCEQQAAVADHPVCAVLKALAPCFVERLGFETPLQEDI